MTGGHVFRDPALRLQALTHRSWAVENGGADNQRLEFLGDAVLQIVISEALYAAHPEWSEGQLSKARSALVQEGALAAIAREIGLGPALRLGRGEMSQGGADKDALLADALEAVLGAVYLDAGLDAARAEGRRWFHGRLDRLDAPPKDPVSTLQEWCQARGRPLPAYVERDRHGPPHATVFTFVVAVDGAAAGEGTATTKKAAKAAAAADALARLGAG